MANQVYPNFVLETKFEDQLNSYLDLMQFCTIDNSLTETAGMIKKFRVYSATSNKTEVLALGEGNTEIIETLYTETPYEIQLFQNRFAYYDEELMTDPMAIDKGLRHQAEDMYNTVNAHILTEMATATNSVTVQAFDFAAFVDAIASMGALEISEARELGGLGLFAIAHKDDVAEIRKALGDELKYVEDYARRGYIGTVAGVSVYVSAIATKGTVIIADKEAVTFFNKVGSQVEQERTDANTRKTTFYARKYGIAVLTNQDHIVKLVKGA